ncbi:abasic site processing protein HMCES [Drosophila grimshawi]|uniref:Abasic site processing protein HMCES n=1 Tax=Drosophila grimshawi TaxID=7222 RepID=B4JFR8_DROGR|nr:abasic site processing protein HMCES [Drosophila grimshawi]EDV93549.1 GH19381 [Drosophila grimshawi]
MCGRTCLTLDPDQVLCACKYPKKIKNIKKEKEVDEKEDIKQEYETPEWRAEFNLGRRYQASYNIAPTDITPVIVSAAHFSEAEDHRTARIVVPMMWGMIPAWHKGDYRRHGLTTNNCRLERLMDSKLYRGPFKRGQRCVVICEGFYEWQTTKQQAKASERDAYLIYVPQESDVKIYDKSTWSPSNVKLLRMAGLFDVWQDEESGDKMYSYSIITFESSKIMSWMHYRMPAILETEQQMNDWLDFKRVSDSQALAALRPATALEWHRVTKLVNNSRNKSEACNKPLESTAAKPEKPKGMLAWLTGHKSNVQQNESKCSVQDQHSQVVKRSSTSPITESQVAKRRKSDDIKIKSESENG